MKSFPAFHRLQGRRVVIAGGDEAAARKARLVAQAGARVEFHAPAFAPALVAEFGVAGVSPARFVEGALSPESFRGAALAFIAVEDDAEAARLAEAARGAGVPVNVVDRPALCDFTAPSIIDRGDVVVAIATEGGAPVLARRLRAAIEALLPQRLGALASFAREFRSAVAARYAPGARRRFWEDFFDGPIAAALLSGDEARARLSMLAALNRPQSEEKTGVIHIVGAGPGDAEHLTLRAFRLLQAADVILYDRLVGADILDLARRDAEKIYVGKARANHSVDQDGIESRMIAHARAGKIVVRLKGGDPFVFGRGGEEYDAAQAAGVPVFVTPGVTAATGCAAAAAMPLTERGLSQAVTFVTGHAQDGAEPDLEWGALARLKHTLVVYMGVATADMIAARLIEAGRAPSTPVAIIENGATAKQKVLKGRLAELSSLIAAGGVAGPAILVIGEVAAKAKGAALAALAQRRAA